MCKVEFVLEHCLFLKSVSVSFAHSVGLSTQDKDHLKFLYEGAEDFSVLPSFGVIPAMPAVFGCVAQHEETRKLNIDPTKVRFAVYFVIRLLS